MSKKKSKKTSEEKTSKSEDSKVERTYSFPTLRKSVKAVSREEALKKVKK